MNLHGKAAHVIAAGMMVAGTGAAPVAPAAAQGIPVYDATSVVQLIETVANQVEQIALLQSQIEAMTGPRGFGLMLNSASDIAERVGVAEGIGGVMDYARTGAEITGNVNRITAAIDEMSGDLDMGYMGDFSASEFPLDRALSTLGGSGLSAVGISEDAYVRSDRVMAQVNEFIPEIETTPDLKASIDLNTRVAVAQLQVQSEILRVLAAQTNTLGAQNTISARDIMTQRQFMIAEDE